ncbi:helix-turn-helix domain-containing protein [Streptomyces sp. NPDC002701]|uniref:helix-turn-helix domain-containing protein n=1 Tax=Streptomyces sp. NPDC002701 TaxID=3364661 RepID=UPI0036B71950
MAGEDAHTTGGGSPSPDPLLDLLELLAAGAPAHACDRLLARARRSARPEDRRRLDHARHLAREATGHAVRHARREADLASLVDTARELAHPARPQAALALLTRRARLLTATDLALAVLHDEETGEAVVRAADGAVGAGTQGHRIPAGALPTAAAHDDPPGPFSTADLLAAPAGPPPAAGRSTADPAGPAAHTAALGALAHAESLHAVLGVPLRTDEKHLGFLYVADRAVRHFTPDEVALLRSLADLGAGALTTARLLARARTANAELERAGTRARAGLRDAIEARGAQDDLFRLALDGIGLDELLTRAARELGGAVGVHGPAGEHLAAHGRLPRATATELDRVRLNAATTGIACPTADGTWAVPLTVRSEDVGTLLFHPDDPGTEPPEQLLLAHARTVSLLLTLRRSTATEGQIRDDLLEDLVSCDGPPPERLLARARRLSADLDRPHVVVVARPGSPAAPLVDGWAGVHARRHRGMRTVRDGLLVLLLPGDDPAARAEEVRARLAAATGAPVTAAASVSPRGAATVHRAHREAVRCLEALGALDAGGVSAAAGDLGFLGVLLADDHDVPGFVERTLGPLLDHDAARLSCLVETLEGWFRAAGSPSRAAELLHVHANTVSRRLERITHLLGPGWQRPEQALELQLALRLHRTRALLAPAPVTTASGTSAPGDPAPGTAARTATARTAAAR